MSEDEDFVRLRHMLDHARDAVSLVHGKRQSDLEEARVLQLALVRLIEIVGEAASRVSKRTQAEHAQIAWAQIIGMRNRLIHGYDFVDTEILWQTVQEDLPELVRTLERVVPQEGSG